MSGFDPLQPSGLNSSETELTPAPRRLFVKSFGCQMNVYDAQRMADLLAPEGYAETTQADDA
ncbi:MAG TPA: hypothetical protein VFF88_06855, partial [Methylocella sp.]|nr:hypothetical protein [Methylocella sp.]